MRIVADTNVLISAFVFPGGPPESVVRAAIEGRLELVTSPALLAEFGRVLTERFGWEPAKVEQAVALVVRHAHVVRPRHRVTVVTDDPSDDRVLEAAAEGRAHIVVSGDRHLLRLRAWNEIRILTPRNLVVELGDP
jgi:putative PIN family toxin of toxin-antitoxin system